MHKEDTEKLSVSALVKWLIENGSNHLQLFILTNLGVKNKESKGVYYEE